MSRLLLIASIALGLLSSLGCGAPQSDPYLGEESELQAVDSRLGVGDFFTVRVYGEDELSGTHQVGDDGTFLFPFLGRVVAEGKTPVGLGEHLAEELESRGYLRRPQVSVLVEEFASKRVSVIGSVARPGTFPLTSGMTIVQAISLAGGFTSIANAGEVELTRREGDSVRRIIVSITRITRGGANDIPLRAGDLIFVPERVF